MHRVVCWGLFLLAYAVAMGYTVAHLNAWQAVQTDALLAFFLLYMLVSVFPIPFKNMAVTLTPVASLVTFQFYGLAVELWLTQLAILISMLLLRFRSLERILLNLAMYVVVSFAAAGAYVASGGVMGSGHSLSQVALPMAVYIGTYLLSNHLLLALLMRVWRGTWPTRTTLHEFLGEMGLTVLASPAGLLIYALYDTVGWLTPVLFSVPITALSFVLRMYYRLKTLHQRLEQVNRLAKMFTSQLRWDKVIDEIFRTARLLFVADCYVLFVVEPDNQVLRPLRVEGNGLPEKDCRAFCARTVRLGEGVSGMAALEKRVLLVRRAGAAHHVEHEPPSLRAMRTIVAGPLIQNGKLVGVFTLGRRIAYGFTSHDKVLLEIFANQAALALENARRYEHTLAQTYIDPLTGLYNYRFFEQQLFRLFERAQEAGEPISLLIVDLDHFKRVNDTYGHEAGNQVLQTVAQLLKENVRPQDIVCRYGGEEFTILFPQTDHHEARIVGEQIRRKMEETPIVVHPTLSEDAQPDTVEIRITCSMGLASYPAHASDPLSLVRHADRALYIGGKKKGRNRLAVYDSA